MARPKKDKSAPQPLPENKLVNIASSEKSYRADYPQIASEILETTNLSPKQLAKAWGVHQCTVERWRREYPELDQAIRGALDNRDVSRAEQALLKVALGYDYWEVHRVPDPNNAEHTVVIKKIKKHQTPNVAALIFFLKNRSPERWVDKQVVEGGVAEELIQRLESAKARVIALKAAQAPDDVIEVAPVKPKQVEAEVSVQKVKSVDKPPLDGHDASSSGGLATGNATAPGAPYGFTKDGKPKLLPGRPRKVSSD